MVDAKLRYVDVLIGQGQSVFNVIRHLAVIEVAYCHSYKEFGGLKHHDDDPRIVMLPDTFHPENKWPT